ncbi:hypothetical protein OUZ56_028557 [Daphnia magna]|uniref:Uncharacterized protein n=1 Tax=Daphnia magna TaxID=35525 RepID=A0ABR0B473_9CRUS|nr:hypothetical protein OUZ56_028557 [Daphnia magna]
MCRGGKKTQCYYPSSKKDKIFELPIIGFLANVGKGDAGDETSVSFEWMRTINQALSDEMLHGGCSMAFHDKHASASFFFSISTDVYNKKTKTRKGCQVMRRSFSMEDRVSIDLVFFSQEEKKADGHPHSSGEGKRNGERMRLHRHGDAGYFSISSHFKKLIRKRGKSFRHKFDPSASPP